MSQHFLLSAKARTLSLKRLFDMSDAEAFDLFKELRWGEGEEVACPCCGSVAKHYFIATRRQWRCRDCKHTFSVTSGTIFAFHKLPLKTYLIAIGIFTNAAKARLADMVRHLLRSASSTLPTSPPYAAATRLSKKASYSTPITVA